MLDLIEVGCSIDNTKSNQDNKSPGGAISGHVFMTLQ